MLDNLQPVVLQVQMAWHRYFNGQLVMVLVTPELNQRLLQILLNCKLTGMT